MKTVKEQKEEADRLFKELQERLKEKPFSSFFNNNIEKNLGPQLKQQVAMLEKRVKVLEDTLKRMKARY